MQAFPARKDSLSHRPQSPIGRFMGAITTHPGCQYITISPISFRSSSVFDQRKRETQRAKAQLLAASSASPALSPSFFS
jgi:hypothetical protein